MFGRESSVIGHFGILVPCKVSNIVPLMVATRREDTPIEFFHNNQDNSINNSGTNTPYLLVDPYNSK